MILAEISSPTRKDIRNALVLHQVIVRWVENDVVSRTRKTLTACWNKVWRTRADKRLGAVEGIVNDSFAKVLKDTTATVEGVIGFTVKDLRRVLKRFRAESFDMTDAQLIEEILRKYLLNGLDWQTRLANYGNELASHLIYAISAGMAEGLSVADIARSIRSVLTGMKSQLERIVRTETMFASNLAALETYSSMGDVVAGVEFDATMDSRTCAVCGGYDGQEFYYDPDPLAGQKGINECPQPPVHVNCRCFLAPISKSWEDLGFKTKGSAPKAASKNQKFPDWLAGQDERIQRKVMGDYYDLYKLSGYDVAHKALLFKMPVDKLGSEWRELWTQSQGEIEQFKLELPPSTTSSKTRKK